MGKVAFITGILGQDGAYLAEFLLGKGYEVHGLVRWDSGLGSYDGYSRLYSLDLIDRITLHEGDMIDANSLNHIIKNIQPDEIYNLAALSHVKVSFETPSSALQINTVGTLNVLESIRILGLEDKVKLYQASSSEMFGSAPMPQNENTAMQPCSPYGVAKLAAYHLACVYRRSYGIFISNGILFNHESPLRGGDFVTHKVTRGVAEISKGRCDPIRLGNLDSVRDWGAAQDYVRGMWMMLQHSEADDFVLATGRSRSVRDFVSASFKVIGRQIEWKYEGINEKGIDSQTGEVLVVVDPEFFRPIELEYLLGDPTKAKDILSWSAQISFDQLVQDMVMADIELLSIEKNNAVGRSYAQ